MEHYRKLIFRWLPLSESIHSMENHPKDEQPHFEKRREPGMVTSPRCLKVTWLEVARRLDYIVRIHSMGSLLPFRFVVSTEPASSASWCFLFDSQVGHRSGIMPPFSQVRSVDQNDHCFQTCFLKTGIIHPIDSCIIIYIYIYVQIISNYI